MVLSVVDCERLVQVEGLQRCVLCGMRNTSSSRTSHVSLSSYPQPRTISRQVPCNLDGASVHWSIRPVVSQESHRLVFPPPRAPLSESDRASQWFGFYEAVANWRQLLVMGY